MAGGLNIFEWLGIVELDNESLRAKGEIEMVECEKVYQDLISTLARYDRELQTAKILPLFAETYAYIQTNFSKLAQMTPANSDDAEENLLKAWEAFFTIADNFQAACDEGISQAERGILTQEISSIISSVKDGAVSLVPDVPIWLKALALISGVAVISLAVAYTVGKFK